VKAPVYFERGAYPYESALGILLNIASIYDSSPVEVFKVMTGKRLKFPEDLLYFNKTSELLPKNKIHSHEQHFPSEFRNVRFDAKKHRIRFCRDCMQVGYHSVFFCLPQVESCVMHGRQLEEICADCYKRFTNRRVPFGACDNCGFYLGKAIDQLPFRADLELTHRIYRAGRDQQKWFSFILVRARDGESFFRMLDDVDSYKTMPSLAALLTQFTLFPCGEREAKAQNRSLRCLHWVFASDKESDFEWSMASYRLMQIHLSYHDECLRLYNQYLRYWGGKEESEQVCLMSLVYFLVRLRLSSLNFQQGRSSQLDLLSFDYVRALERSFAGFRFIPSKLIRIYFLKLLFHIHVYLRAGYIVRIAMQPWKGVFYDLVARSMKSHDTGETFLSIVPLSQRSCGAALTGEKEYLVMEECQFTRLGDNYFIIKQGSMHGDEMVDVFI
jgi:hypothetical protein